MKCSIETCDREAKARGWCYTHWKRWSKHGNPMGETRIKGTPCKCSVESCDRKLYAKGLCEAHYARFRRVGNISPNKPITYSHPLFENHKWKGERIIAGRVYIYCPGHPFGSSRLSYVPRYRLVVESILGRFLDRREVVHHKNGKVTDDRPENLELMFQSEHIKRHMVNGKLVKA